MGHSVVSALDLVVFDMDGVLVELDRARRLQLLAEMTGKQAAFLRAAIWDSDFETRAEMGAYPTGEAYLAEFNRRVGCALTAAQWTRARRQAMTLDSAALRIAEQVSRQCPIAMLTNNGALLFEALPTLAPELHQTFGASAHASFQFQARKPQPEVFTRLLTLHGVIPSRALFIDDTLEFVEGARLAGLHAIHYAGERDLRSGLNKLGFDVQAS